VQFSLRTLLLLLTVLVLWLGYKADQVHRQRAAAAAVERLHGSLHYDDSLSDSSVRKWLVRWLGRETIANVDGVYLGGTSVSDDDLARLKGLPRLRTVVLTSSAVTDAGLPHLRDLTGLQTVDLRFTPVTDDGLASLRRALPQATILGKSDIE
jgi:hypothetical protein